MSGNTYITQHQFLDSFLHQVKGDLPVDPPPPESTVKYPSLRGYTRTTLQAFLTENLLVSCYGVQAGSAFMTITRDEMRWVNSVTTNVDTGSDALHSKHLYTHFVQWHTLNIYSRHGDTSICGHIEEGNRLD